MQTAAPKHVATCGCLIELNRVEGLLSSHKGEQQSNGRAMAELTRGLGTCSLRGCPPLVEQWSQGRKFHTFGRQSLVSCHGRENERT